MNNTWDPWQLGITNIADIVLVAIVVYFLLSLVRGTRAVQMLIGLAVVVLAYEAASMFGLLTLEWLFSHFFSAFIVIIAVIFQPELRRALTQVGVSPLRTSAVSDEIHLPEHLTEATFSLAERGWGGLIVIERETGLKHLYETGVELHAPVQADIMQALFCPYAPTHDGAVIVNKGMIVASRVLLPLARATAIPGYLGTRHRAGMGMSEESDALIIVISEETRGVRLCYNATLSDELDRDALQNQLRAMLVEHTNRDKT
ncbi:MAG: diadenylate cyclase [Mariprofundales bacterium]